MKSEMRAPLSKDNILISYKKQPIIIFHKKIKKTLSSLIKCYPW